MVGCRRAMHSSPQDEATHRGAQISARASSASLRDEPLVAIVTTSAGGIIVPVRKSVV